MGCVCGGTHGCRPTRHYFVGADDPVRPGPVTQHFVGQGPCALPGVRGEKNPPVTALPCQPPLSKGAEGTGERIATGALRPRNDREFYKGAGNVRRDDVGIVPYERARGPYGRAVGDAGPYERVSWGA